MIEVSVRCLGFLYSPRTVVEKAYLSMNSAILSHKMKEDEEAGNFKLTTDRGLHHGGSMVASVLAFSSSSFFSTGMVTWGHPWGVKNI